MKRMSWMIGAALLAGVGLGVAADRLEGTQDPLKAGKVLARTTLAGAKNLDVLLVLRDLPPGGESGWHTQGGNEIAYVLDGSVTFEVRGKPAVTLKTGDTFQTIAGEVHNVKNASATAPGKALVFYVAKKGAELDDLSKPAK